MNTFLQRFKDAFDLNKDKDFFHRVKESIESGIYFRGVNLYILIFAILICSLGLDVNSTAVIIGAMLISPLMGPIIGVGFGLGTTNWVLIQRSVRNYVIATIIALVSSTVYFILSPLNLEQSELLARTSPTIYDVMIAFFGGFAGIIATSSKQKGNVIPGVAIATALMPPLCTAGFGLAALNFQYFFGALYLYLINTVFIAMATFLACRIIKFPVRQTEPRNIAKARNIGIAAALLTFLPAVYLGVVLYNQTRFESNAQKFITEQCRLPDNYLFSNTVDFKNRRIELVYGGGTISDSLKQSLSAKLSDYRLEKAKLDVVESFSKSMEDINKNISGVYNRLDEKTNLLKKLSFKFDSFEKAIAIQNAEIRILQNISSVKTVTISSQKDGRKLVLITPREIMKRRRTVLAEITESDSLSISEIVGQHVGNKNFIIKILKE